MEDHIDPPLKQGDENSIGVSQAPIVCLGEIWSRIIRRKGVTEFSIGLNTAVKFAQRFSHREPPQERVLTRDDNPTSTQTSCVLLLGFGINKLNTTPM